MAAVGLFENFLFRNFSHSDVIEASPFVVETVLNKRIIVPTVRISIMNTDCVQVIRVALKASIGLLNLMIFLSNLFLHVINLALHFFCVLVQEFHGFLHLVGVFLLEILLI
jgi:hypothetical protein